MTGTDDDDRLRERIAKQARRMQRAERESPSLLGQTVYLGTLGLVLVLPIVAGAYLGDWLDELAGGASVHWTVGLILLGVVVGMVNVYLMIRE